MTENFRINNQRLLLTYSQAGHFDKEEYINWIRDRSTVEISFIRLAHEIGDDGTNYHTHAVIEYVKPFQTRDCRYYDYRQSHAHIRVLKNKKAFEDAKKYIAKEDPENADLLMKKDCLFTRVKACDTMEEALEKYVHRPNDVAGIVQLYNMKKNEPTRFNFTPSTPWQLWLLDLDAQDPDPRKVHWIYDPVGNCGKTAMAKWLHINRPGQWYICKDLGTSRDCATIIKGAIEGGGWTGWGLILDLPRSAENHIRLYSYIEEIKDGFVTATKYTGGTCVFDTPHLVVFANWLPQVECLSLDRWHIQQADRVGGGLTLIPPTSILNDRQTDRQTDHNKTVEAIMGYNRKK